MAVQSMTPRRAVARRRFGSREYRANLRYFAFGRVMPLLFFGWLGWKQLSALPAGLGGGSGAILHLLPNALYAVFCTIPVAIYVARPRPTARDGRLIARAAAFGGTALQLLVGAFVPAGLVLYRTPGWLDALTAAATVVAYAFAIWGLSYLRRSLSIVPEARRLTTGGPYRLVRHPLYLAEIMAGLALALSAGRIVPLATVAAFAGLQILRTHFEERLLLESFPGYAGYRAATRRLIPLVW